MPAEKGERRERGLGDDPELVGERSEDNRDVVDALVIRHEHVGLAPLEPPEALRVHLDARGCEDEPRPGTGAAMGEPAVALKEARHDRDRPEHDRVDGNGRDQPEDRAPPVEGGDSHGAGRTRRAVASLCNFSGFSAFSGAGGAAPGAVSMNRPKIILPAVVCRTLVTTTSMVFPIIRRALSTTTIVPSSRYATPWLYSFPSLRMNTFMISPGSTTGLSELASRFRLRTSTPRSWATLFRLKSLVTILPWRCRASSMSFRSTSRSSGKSTSEIVTSTPAIFWILWRMSSPRRPRFRLSVSPESATSCSSLSTNCGTTSVPSMKPVSHTSAMRPPMITL